MRLFLGILSASLLCSSVNSAVLAEYGKGRLQVHFWHYNNSDNKLIDGHFCDIDFQGNRKSNCDPTFQFEILREGGSGESLFHYTQPTYTKDTGSISFGPIIGRMKNPISLQISLSQDSTHGRIFLKVRVEDHDEDWNNELMDIFVYHLEDIYSEEVVNIESKATGHKLKFSYIYNCDPDYFGHRCLTFCTEEDTDTTGHYRCTPQGEKVCLDGWINVDQDCKVPAWCRWC